MPTTRNRPLFIVLSALFALIAMVLAAMALVSAPPDDTGKLPPSQRDSLVWLASPSGSSSVTVPL